MNNDNTSYHFDPILKMPDVAALVSYSVSQLYRLIKAGGFPQPVRLGPGRVGIRRSKVEAWLREREEEGRS